MSNSYKVIVKKYVRWTFDNDGKLYIDLPDKLMKSLNWKIGDELVWEETDVLGDKGDYLGAYICRRVDWDNDLKSTRK